MKKRKIPLVTISHNTKTLVVLLNNVARDLMTQEEESYAFVIRDPATGALSLKCFKAPDNTIAVNKIIRRKHYMSRISVPEFKGSRRRGRYTAIWDDVENSLVISNDPMPESPKLP